MIKSGNKAKEENFT